MSENGVYGALVKAQEEFPPITRDRAVTVETRTGGSYTFAYAPLDSIMAKVGPVLAKNSLAVTQTFGVSETGGPLLETALVHSDGSKIRGSLPLPVHQGASAQELGSLVTYCRRYAIVAILGLATEEDDDANHASGNTVQARQGGSQNAGGTSSGGPVKPVPAASENAADGPPDPHGLQASRADAVQPGQVIVPFGKHKGTQVKDVPRSYWDWWLAQDGNKNQEVLAAVELHLGLTTTPAGDTLDPSIPF